MLTPSSAARGPQWACRRAAVPAAVRPVNRPPTVAVSAKGRGRTEQPEDAPTPSTTYEDVLSEVNALSYLEMQRRLREQGLPANGKKEVVAERLAQAMYSALGGSSGAGGSGVAMDGEDWGPTEQAFPAETEELEEAQEVDSATLREELFTMSVTQLKETLETFNLSTSGDKAELVERLAVCMEEDMQREREEKAAMAETAPATELTEELKAALVEKRASVFYEELVPKKRQELFNELKASVEPGTHVPYVGRDDLAQQLATLRATQQLEEEMADEQAVPALIQEATALLDEQQQRRGRRTSRGDKALAAGATEHITGFNNCGTTMTMENATRDGVLSMTQTMMKKLKADELRVALALMGEPDAKGNRYILVEKLIRLTSAELVTSTSQADGQTLADTVAGMPLRLLRSQLTARNLDATGSRVALEERLRTAIKAEQDRAEQARLEEEEANSNPAPLSPLRPDTRLLHSDPSVTVNIVFGAPSGGADDLQGSLDAALCAAAALHTAWPPLAQPPQSAQSDPHTDTEGHTDDAGEGEASQPLEGVTARLLYLTPDYNVIEIPPAALQGVSALDLLSGTPWLDTTTFTVQAYTGTHALTDAVAASGPNTPHTLLSVVSLTGMTAGAANKLEGVLAAAGGQAVSGERGVIDKLTLSRTLRAEGYPVLPTHTLQPPHTASDKSFDQWKGTLQTWAETEGYHTDRQLFVVKPSTGSGGEMVIVYMGVEQAALAAKAVMQTLQGVNTDSKQGGSSDPVSVLVQPCMRGAALQCTVTVVDGTDGPVALLPTEIEICDIEDEIFESEVHKRERDLMKMGLEPETIDDDLHELRANGAAYDADHYVHTPQHVYPHTTTVKYHHPPRLPSRQVHTLRHAAALLYKKMGLRGGATLDVWVAMEPGWQDKYEPVDDGLGRLLPDADPEILNRWNELQDKEAEALGLPLSEYVNPYTHTADLTKFNPRTRLHAAYNKEATFYVTDVNAGLSLHPAATPFIQASELGLSHSALLRNLVSAALRSAANTAAPAKSASGKGRKSASPPPPESASSLQLSAPPPIDLIETPMLSHWKLDRYEQLQTVTEWREYQWLLANEDMYERADRLNDAEALVGLIEEAVQGSPSLPTHTDGSIDQNMAWYALAEDWDPEFDSRPAESLSDPGQEPPTLAEWDAEQRAEVNALRAKYPGLGDEQLMYVKLGRYKDLRPIDTNKLQARLDELASQGLSYLSEDVFEECLIDVYSTQEPELASFDNHAIIDITSVDKEQEPGGYMGALAVPDALALDTYNSAQDSYANAGMKGVRKVWLLVAGSPDNATQSLAAARDVAVMMANCDDVHVEILMVAPGTFLHNQESVRSELLRRRVEWLSSGIPEAELTEVMDYNYMRRNALELLTPQDEMVWALPMAKVLQPNAHSVTWAAEASQRLQGTAIHSLPTLQQQSLTVLAEVQREVDAAGLQGVGGLWGGAMECLPPPPRVMSVADLINEAATERAIIIPMLRGGEHGYLLELLHQAGAVFTGSGAIASLALSNKMLLPSTLDSVKTDLGIESLPTQMLGGPGLANAAGDAPLCTVLLEEIRESIIPDYISPLLDPDGPGTDPEPVPPDFTFPPLCVRPGAGADGVGVARIDTPEDLEIYCTALNSRTGVIPANTLSVPHRAIPMPGHIPDFFTFTPWIDTDIVLLTPHPTNPSHAPTITHTPVCDWLEVSICMLGNAGTMEPLGVSVKGYLDPDAQGVVRAKTFVAPPELARSRAGGGDDEEAAAAAAATAAMVAALDSPFDSTLPATDTDTHASTSSDTAVTADAITSPSSVGDGDNNDNTTAQDDSGQKGAPPMPVYLTPPPETVLSGEIVKVLCDKVRDLADEVGCVGLVRVDAFVCRETGEMRLVEVDVCPSLAQGSLVYQQALRRAEGPMTPVELIRTIVNLGIEANREEGGLTDMDQAVADVGEDADLSVLAEFESQVVEPGDDDSMEDLGALQASLTSANKQMMGQSDINDFYLSSTGRGARRGRPARAAVGGSGRAGAFDMDDDYTGGGMSGMGTSSGVLGDRDFDFDAQGDGPEDPDIESSWGIRDRDQ